MLANVIKAIADLNDDNGSTVNCIAERLKCYIIKETKFRKDKCFERQMRTALKHAIQTGIIIHKGNRYKLGLLKGRYKNIENEENTTNQRVRKTEKSPLQTCRFLSEIKLETNDVKEIVGDGNRTRCLNKSTKEKSQRTDKHSKDAKIHEGN